MKSVTTIIALFILIGGGWYLYSTQSVNEGENQVANVGSAVETKTAVMPGSYSLNPAESIVNWEASKPLIAGYTHHGTIGLSSGNITVGESSATGTFTINVAGLKVTSLGGGKAGKESALETHLKTKDFFETDKYPTGAFAIDEVVKNIDSDSTHIYTIKGNLTLKNKTNPVEFPASIYMEDNVLIAEGELSIDRTKWGITFGSKNFFSNFAENAIDDMVKLTLKIRAQKN